MWFLDGQLYTSSEVIANGCWVLLLADVILNLVITQGIFCVACSTDWGGLLTHLMS